MSKADKTFSRTEIVALKACIGRELGSVDAVFVAREDLAWNTVRLHLDGLALDIDCRLGDVEVDEFGTLEEFGLVSVAEAADERLCMPDVSADTTVLDVGERVLGVSVLNCRARVFGDGRPVATVEYPQAVAFRLQSGYVVVDRETSFSEMLAVKRGTTMDGLLYDDSASWEDDPEEDPGTHYEYETELVCL